MASEILAVPEERLAEVIAVIREGIIANNELRINQHRAFATRETERMLMRWCAEEEKYLDSLGENADG